MARWLVQLAGERMDLEEYPRWFPDGEVFCIEENGVFYLAGPTLDRLATSEAVRDAATATLDRLTGIVALLWPNLRRPTIHTVIREQDNGRRDLFVAVTGVSARIKVGNVGAGPGSAPQPTQAQVMLERVVGGSHLDLALSLWADPQRSWGRLYRILEEVEQHLEQPVDAAGLCSSAERTRFTRTANTAEVAGPDARHASGKFTAPADPMTAEDAARFVGRMLAAVLR